jgi:hypothetical protein
MKHSILITSSLLIAGVATGCASADGKSSPASRDRGTAAVQLDKAKAETREAAQAVQDYAYAQKAEFVDKMKRDLVEIQGELDQLSAKVDKSRGAAKAGAKTKLESVREKWAQAKKHLDQAESATESTWDDVKNGTKKAYNELKDGFQQARQWVSDKIAP